MKIDIETVLGQQKWCNRINELDLYEIEFYENGKKLRIPIKVIQQFEFTGMNNLDFITTGEYKGTQWRN